MSTLLKYGLCIFSILYFMADSDAQNTYLPYAANHKQKKDLDLYRNGELSMGYIPSSDNKGLKSFLSVNNFLFKRLGAYTSLEYELESKKLSHTLGGTISLHKYFYLWGGMDLFTSNGFIQNGFYGPRKEVGFAITPYKRSVLRLGWSNSVGISIAAGFHIPF